MRVLVAGLGTMGRSHALAQHAHPDTRIVALVNRSAVDLPEALRGYPLHRDFHDALAETRPDLVVIATYTDTHADYAIAAMEAGAHVFVEKPFALTLAEAERVRDSARRLNRKLGIGYILRHHPRWQRLIAEARALGGPYVFRLNLNRHSTGAARETRKALMRTTSPVIDCGVHYVDVMRQITDARPVRVRGMGMHLSNEIAPDMYSYGQFQVFFEDGSVGWYEAGWGPMMSETALFVKDIVSPAGSVSTIDGEGGASDDTGGHARVGALRVHRTGNRPGEDRLIPLPEEPGHQALCDTEQGWIVSAIEADADMTRHVTDAVQSLRLCLAADESIRSGRTIDLGEYA